MKTVLVCYKFYKCITKKYDVVRWDGMLEAYGWILVVQYQAMERGIEGRVCAWRGSIK